MIAGALLIPRYGYTKFIVDINTLLYVPLFLPSVWGLFSKKIGLKAVWVTTIAGFLADMLAGIVTPFLILIGLELFEKQESPGWERAMSAKRAFHEIPAAKTYTLPGKMVAASLAVIAILMGALSAINREEAGILITLAIVLVAIAGILYWFLKRADRLGRSTA